MPLFRKKSQSQAERLASWRSESLQRGGVADEGLAALLEELGADFSEHRDGTVVEVGGGRLFVGTIDDGTTLSGWAPFAGEHDAAELAALLRRNLDPVLVWTSRSDVGGEDELGARFAVPLDGFERGAVLLALETMAGSLGDEALAGAPGTPAGPRAARPPSSRPMRAAEAVKVALDTAGLPAEDDPERPGIGARRPTAASSQRSCATTRRACC